MHSVRHHFNIAVLFIARSHRRTVTFNSHVTIVRRKELIRIKAPHRICHRPTSLCYTHFLNRIGRLSLPNNGTLFHTRSIIIKHRNNLTTAIRRSIFLNNAYRLHLLISTPNSPRVLTHIPNSRRCTENTHIPLSVTHAFRVGKGRDTGS